ncbi:nuclear transport factor 2 family protein [bacterium]|nr:nuclear transport factor 2 family protein [bacterium]
MSHVPIVSELLSALQAGAVARAGALIADDFTFDGGVPCALSRDEFLKTMRGLAIALPGWTFELGGVDESGDTVSATVAISGTHDGPLDIPHVPPVMPTGTLVRLPEDRWVFAIRDGRVASIHVQAAFDGGLSGLLEQIGIEYDDA